MVYHCELDILPFSNVPSFVMHIIQSNITFPFCRVQCPRRGKSVNKANKLYPSAKGLPAAASGQVPGQCVSASACLPCCCACSKVCSCAHTPLDGVRFLPGKHSLPPMSCRRTPFLLLPLPQFAGVALHNLNVHFQLLFRCLHCPCTFPFFNARWR